MHPTDPDTTATPAIRLRDVAVRYDQTELRFDCAFEKGSIVAVAGASGSGKSTLLNLVAGFETPDEGSIEIDGQDVAGRDPGARPVSVIFQEHNLFSHLDVGTNVALGFGQRLRLATKDKARVSGALLRVGLEGFGKRMPPTLSGGERQRVALARALVRRKAILLLDEPFAALDPGLRSGMRDLLWALHAQEQNTILLVTHHPDDVAALADSVIFLDKGKVLVQEPAEHFLARSTPLDIVRFLGR